MYKNRKVTAVIVAAGSARRMGGINKQYAELAGMPVLARSVAAFDNDPFVDEIVIVARSGEEDRCRRDIVEKYGFRRVSAVVPGGAERQDSVRAALGVVFGGAAGREAGSCDAEVSDGGSGRDDGRDVGLVLVHDGARPLVPRTVIDAVIDGCAARGAAIPAVSVKDTIKQIHLSDNKAVVSFTPERSLLRAVQTPQGFDAALLMRAYDACAPDTAVTDDASLVEALGAPVYIVDGDEMNIKITTPSDLGRAEQLLNGSSADDPGINDPVAAAARVPRTGMGYDVHAFAENRKLILGGVNIPHDRGLLGHSDADVLIHAVMDALLGAAALGDIGKHFPDTDLRYKGISSLLLLGHVSELLSSHGWTIVNIDVTVIAQRPKIAPHIPQMKKIMAEVLKISESQINIKGTTTERLGFTGREEGIASQAVASIIRL
ncbi:MAG: 2-C-methyl-D-erythritol 2,4-cyclodiphosphate synthase [Anaerovoracaceae bacterium]|nr:2-C-methyl-D-erythritol 2,4-cyclodiphosphate synthase [Anaerovoracaceae bacterium]